MNFGTPWIGKKNLNVTGSFSEIQNICTNISLNEFFQDKYLRFTLIIWASYLLRYLMSCHNLIKVFFLVAKQK